MLSCLVVRIISFSTEQVGFGICLQHNNIFCNDEDNNRLSYQNSIAAILELLDVFLQDAAVLQELGVELQLWALPCFQHALWKPYKDKVLQAHQGCLMRPQVHAQSAPFRKDSPPAPLT